jgi:hypothetical protein
MRSREGRGEARPCPTAAPPRPAGTSHPRFAGHPSMHAYGTHLDDWFAQLALELRAAQPAALPASQEGLAGEASAPPLLWFSGHTHFNFDLHLPVRGSCRRRAPPSHSARARTPPRALMRGTRAPHRTPGRTCCTPPSHAAGLATRALVPLTAPGRRAAAVQPVRLTRRARRGIRSQPQGALRSGRAGRRGGASSAACESVVKALCLAAAGGGCSPAAKAAPAGVLRAAHTAAGSAVRQAAWRC